jgi:type IV secretory pathway VirB2 component (pilin)
VKISNRAQSMLTLALAVMLLLIVADPALAAGTVKTKVNDFVCSVLDIVNAVGYAVVFIAIFIFGYQVGFGGKRPTEAAPVLVGGLIIGIAGVIAEFFVAGGSSC